MKKFLHGYCYGTHEEVIRQLHNVGAQGWELVSVLEDGDGRFTAYIKKEADEPIETGSTLAKPHITGTKERPTHVYKGEWLRRPCDISPIVLLEYNETTGSILGVFIDGPMRDFSTHLEGFVFHNEPRHE